MQEVFAIPVVDEIKNDNSNSEDNESESENSGNENSNLVITEVDDSYDNENIDDISPDDLEELFHSQTA